MLSVRADTTVSVRNNSRCGKPTPNVIEALSESFCRDELRDRPRCYP
jgi:hypothetical protein